MPYLSFAYYNFFAAMLEQQRLVELLLARKDEWLAEMNDGTADEEIMVTVGTLIPAEVEDGPLHVVGIRSAEHGVTVSLDAPPPSLADMWMVLDSNLENEGLITTNIYRQLLDADGTTTFQAPVREYQVNNAAST